MPLEWHLSMTTTGPFWLRRSHICSSLCFSSSRVTAICVEMFLLQQITTSLLPDEDAPESLNWKIDAFVLISHKATRPFSEAEAKMCPTYRFQDTEVTYELMWGFFLPGLRRSGLVGSWSTSKMKTSVLPKASMWLLSPFHSAHITGKVFSSSYS